MHGAIAQVGGARPLTIPGTSPDSVVGALSGGGGAGGALGVSQLLEWVGPWEAWVGPLQVLAAGWVVCGLIRDERYAPGDLAMLLLLLLVML